MILNVYYNNLELLFINKIIQYYDFTTNLNGIIMSHESDLGRQL